MATKKQTKSKARATKPKAKKTAATTKSKKTAVKRSSKQTGVNLNMRPRNYAAVIKVVGVGGGGTNAVNSCLLYTSPSPRDRLLSRMPSSA